jgi:ABC-2 type transport system permease protein
MVIATPSFMLSGFTWPLSQMPGWVVTLANMIPLTHYLQVFRVLVIENGTVGVVQGQLWGMAIIALVTFVASVILLQLKIRKVKA